MCVSGGNVQKFEVDLHGAQTLRILCYCQQNSVDSLLGKGAIEVHIIWNRNTTGCLFFHAIKLYSTVTYISYSNTTKNMGQEDRQHESRWGELPIKPHIIIIVKYLYSAMGGPIVIQRRWKYRGAGTSFYILTTDTNEGFRREAETSINRK